MLGKKLLFKNNVKSINIKESDHVYTVMKICDDDEMIKKYQLIQFDTNPPVSPHGSVEDSVTSLKCKTLTKRANTELKSCIQAKEKKEQGHTSTNRVSKKGRKKLAKRVRMIIIIHQIKH
ncbi:hypothetical protein PIB30_040329 [Stylosanthes scabra]|nr:hypothetical protein [Stylosanthes scabra]